MTSTDTLKELTDQTKEKCLEWVKDIHGESFFVDPLDHEEISAHYGASHAAVAFLILGIKNGDSDLEAMGVKLLTSVLNRWGDNSKLPSFHNDFNHFALCVGYGYIYGRYTDLAARIKATVLSTPDSPHDTVNWIPMRWFVNKCRYDWTKNEKYLSACTVCADKIKSATYEDGFIDDRLPRGMSFNLQYNVATVAVLQYLRNHGEELDISKEMGALLNAVAPDGDINYLGRGTNQIFAWGLWLYMLASADLENDLQKALGYCFDKIPVMLEKNNLMLNDWDGAEKYLWWDYHYCSVYTAHLLFWLALAIEDAGKGNIAPKLSEVHDSGVEIVRKDGWFVATFAGRSEYLAERGPVIAAIGREDGKMFVKGTFGPWQGSFGRKYVFHDLVIKNFCGLLKMRTERDWSGSRITRRITRGKVKDAILQYYPFFSAFQINASGKTLTITYKGSGEDSTSNLVFQEQPQRTELIVDGDRQLIANTGSFRNQYTWVNLYQSRLNVGREWKIVMTSED